MVAGTDKLRRSRRDFATLALIAVTVVLSGLSTANAAPSFRASVDRTSIGLGETVTLNLVFENGTPRAWPTVPTIKDLDVVGVPNQSSNFSMINGQTTTTITLSYILRPRKEGEYQIPACEADVDGRRLASQPVTFKVVKNTAAAGAGSAGDQAFLRLIVPKTEFFVGEIFPVEIDLYCRAAQDVRLPQLQADGFALGKTSQPTETRTLISNQLYNVVTLKLSATALKSGNLTFGPAECDLNLQVPSARRNPFSDFFGSNYELRPAHLRTESAHQFQRSGRRLQPHAHCLPDQPRSRRPSDRPDHPERPWTHRIARSAGSTPVARFQIVSAVRDQSTR
jgi:hypothetical protein